MSNRRPPGDATPKAPPAFPSIPLGTALESLQISEEEAAALRTPPPAPAATRPPTPAPPSVPTGPIPDDGRTLWYALLALGCLASLALAGILTLGVVGIGLYIFVVNG